MSDAMNPESSSQDAIRLDATSDLQTVLAAWHGATLRLERTHDHLRDEVRRLTAELEIKNRELARKNRLADLGQMAAHVAHEVRNNLVPVSLYLSLLRRRLADDAASADILDKIDRGYESLDRMVQDLLHFTAERDPRLARFELASLVCEVLSSLEPQLEAQSIAVRFDVPRRLMVEADGDMLRRAVLNLALNAIDAMQEGGELSIAAVDCHDRVEVEVADSGMGLSDEARRRAFEPFFTTKASGTGLGLAIVYRLAEAHGGFVRAMNCPDGGAAFTFSIPTRRRARMERAA